MSSDSKSRFQATIKISNEPSLQTCSSQELSSLLRSSSTNIPPRSLTTLMATVITPVKTSDRASKPLTIASMSSTKANMPLVKANTAIVHWQRNQSYHTVDQAVNFIPHTWRFFTSSKPWKKLVNYLLFTWMKRMRKDFSTFLFS